MVVINLDDLWVSLLKILGIKPARFFSNSIWSLFAETKAISIPEKNADKIIILDGGEIIQQGSHNQLINQKGYYKELYEQQLLEKEN